MAIAPLTHFLPSKRQRQVARLREYAAVHGLFVEFRDLPGSREAGKQMGRRPEQIIYYGLRLPASRKQPRGQRAWLRSALQDQLRESESVLVWRGVGHREAANGCLSDLPAAVRGVGLDEASCGIYWQEAGTQEDVEDVRSALNRWAEALK